MSKRHDEKINALYPIKNYSGIENNCRIPSAFALILTGLLKEALFFFLLFYLSEIGVKTGVKGLDLKLFNLNFREAKFGNLKNYGLENIIGL